MRAIRRAFPEAHLAILIKKELASFFDGANWIDEVIPYSVARGFRGLNDRRKIVGEIRCAPLRPRGADAQQFRVGAMGDRWPEFLGAPDIALDARGAMLTHKAAPPRDALDGHQVHYWLAMVRETLGIDGDADDLAISADASASRDDARTGWRHIASVPMRRLIAIAPAAAYGPAKEWPAAKFAAVIDALADRIGAECVLVGAPSERAKCEEVASLSSPAR